MNAGGILSAADGCRLTGLRRLWLVMLALTTLTGAAEPKRVLVIHSFVNAAPPFTTHSTAFETALTEGMGERVDFDEISLDVARYTDLEMEEALVELMRKRQAKWQPHLVVPVGSPAGVFVARYRDRLFPKSTPIIYTGMDLRRLPPGTLEHNATFVGESFNIPAMLDDMLQVAPATTNIAVVIGASALEQYWADAFRSEWSPFTNRVGFTWLNDLSLDQMVKRVNKLPPHSFIFLILLMRDATGVTHDQDRALRRLHAAANAPINGIFEHQLGLGIVGGRLYQAELEGVESARVAIRVLRGEPVTNFPPSIIGPREPRYDWRQLQRWKISEKSLPSGSKVLFRQQTIWQAYKDYMVGIGALIAIQAAVISILLANLIKRRRAERSLVESEARFRNVANTAPVMIWMMGPDKSCTFLNTSWLKFRGRTMEEELGDGWAEGIHPEDYKRSLETYTESFDARRSFTMEYRLRKYNGEYRWVLDSGVPRLAKDGTFLGYTGSVVDISTMKETEAELRASKERMTLAAEAAHLGMWLWDMPTNRLWLSDKCRELFGFASNDAASYETMLRRIHPEDREAEDKAVRRAIAEKTHYEMEYRLLLPDETIRWIAASGRVDYNGGDKPSRMLGVCIDISERRRAEEAAQELSGRLINAQEDERRRIARDLHDDLNQRLALLSVEMELFGRTPSGGEELTKRLEQLTAHVKEISSEVHKLSYELHPAKLDQLGLVAAARAFCRETSQRSGVRVDFVPGNVPNKLPGDVALCLYRVLQESIHNVVRHSGAKEAHANLMMQGKTIRLIVADSGKGFDVDHARKNGGLGLVSMEERIRLVHGTIAVRSQPGAGTRVELSVPVPDLQQH